MYLTKSNVLHNFTILVGPFNSELSRLDRFDVKLLIKNSRMTRGPERDRNPSTLRSIYLPLHPWIGSRETEGRSFPDSPTHLSCTWTLICQGHDRGTPEPVQWLEETRSMYLTPTLRGSREHSEFPLLHTFHRPDTLHQSQPDNGVNMVGVSPG